MSGIGELAAKYERIASGGHARALDAATEAVRARLLDALGAHVRTGNAISELRVVAGAGGIQIEEARYQKFIKGVRRADELQGVAAEAYGAHLRGELDAS